MSQNEHHPAETILEEYCQRNDAGLVTATAAGDNGRMGTGEVDKSKGDDPIYDASESPSPANEAKLTVENDAGKMDSDSILQDILDTQRDILNAIQGSTIARPTGKGVRSHFWAKYKKVADEHDDELLERYNGEMDIVLIFSGLFSAVSTSFIVAMESTLSPNSSDTTNVLLTQLVQIALGNTAAGNVPGQATWTGPSHAQVWIQSIAYASLSTSLLAAFGAVLGKQWLGYCKSNRYGRGSLEEQSKRRQEKLDGIINWYFDAVVQSFPVLIQLSLFLFATAIGANMWLQQQTIASVIIVTTVLGFLFYMCTVIMSLLSPACPFQTPVSTVLRLAKVDEPLVAALHFCQDVVRKTNTVAPALWGTMHSNLNTRSRFRALAGLVTIVKGHIDKTRSWWKSTIAYIGKVKTNLLCYVPRAQHDLESSPMPEDQPCQGNRSEDANSVLLSLNSLPVSQLDARSVQWLLETSTDPDVLLAATRMVPEIDWPQAVDISATFKQLVEAFRSCYNLQDQIIPGTEERALTCALAVTHLFHEYHSSDVDHALRDRFLHDILVSGDWSRFETRWREVVRYDARLKLLPCDINGNDMSFPNFNMSDMPSSGLLWVSHILPHIFCVDWIADSCRVKSAVKSYPYNRSLAITVVSRLLQPESPSPSQQIVANCAFIVCCMLGLRFQPKDLKRVDKSSALRQLGNALVSYLSAVLPGTHPGSYEWRCIPLISRILELSPPLVTKEDTEGFHSIIRLQHSTLLADVVTNWQCNRGHHPVQEAADYVHAALRIAVVVGGGGIYQPDDLRVLLWGSFSNLSSETTNSLVNFLFYLSQDSFKHSVTIGDVLLVLGKSHPSDLERYLQVITVCMGSDQPDRVRHAALHAAYNARLPLAELDNPEALGFHSSTSESFSQALFRLPVPDIKEYYLNYYLEHYAKLLYTLTKNSIWAMRLLKTGHIQRCVVDLQHDIMSIAAAYRFVAIVQMYTSSKEVAPYKERLWSTLLHHWFWNRVTLAGDEAKETITDIVKLTIECMPRDYDAKKRNDDVERALSGMENLRLTADGQTGNIAALDELTNLLLGNGGLSQVTNNEQTLAGGSSLVPDVADV